MFGAILKAKNSSFQKGMTFCRSIYVKKAMKLLAFIFEQPSYCEISEVQIIRNSSSDNVSLENNHFQYLISGDVSI